MSFLLRILTAVFLLPLLVLSKPALAEDVVSAKAEGMLYECPYLNDETRRSIAQLTQGNDGWFFREGDINEYFDLLPHAQNYLMRLSQAFASQGTQLYLLEVPPRPFVGYRYFNKTQAAQKSFNMDDALRYYKHYMQQLESTGAKVVQLLDEKDEIDPQTGLHFFFKRDTHWTPFGAKLTAQRVAEVLKKNSKYQQIKPAVYKTEVKGQLEMKSTIAMEVESLCTDNVPAEPFPSYQTNAQLDKGKDALFGDISSSPPLVLLGSSFSAVDWFNFDGFLSEYTGLEVANFAISAGKLFNAIVSYTALPKAERLSPDFVLWENLAHYDFNLGDTMFRQIIPAVYGECSESEAIKTAQVSMTGAGDDSIELFTIPADQKVSGTNYFLFLKSNNLGLSNFTLEMDYDDGDGEWFVLDRREHFNNSGRFFVELSDEISSNLTHVRLVGLPEVKAKLDVRLCRIDKKS